MSGKTLSEPEPDILRCFSARGDLRTIFPVVAQLPNKIERPGDDDGVVRSGSIKCVFECRFRLRNDREMRGVVRRDLRKLGYGNRSRRPRLRENHLGRMRKKNASNFVHGLVAQRAKHQPDLSATEVLLQECSKLSRRRGIVRAIQIYIRLGLNPFETPGPNRFGDPLRDRLVRNRDTRASVGIVRLLQH